MQTLQDGNLTISDLKLVLDALPRELGGDVFRDPRFPVLLHALETQIHEARASEVKSIQLSLITKRIFPTSVTANLRS